MICDCEMIVWSSSVDDAHIRGSRSYRNWSTKGAINWTRVGDLNEAPLWFLRLRACGYQNQAASVRRAHKRRDCNQLLAVSTFVSCGLLEFEFGQMIAAVL